MPDPGNSNGVLTCYVTVIKPNQAAKTYYYDVTVTSTTLTVSGFSTVLNNAVMDDLIESMQIYQKLAALSSQMTVSQKSTAIL